MTCTMPRAVTPTPGKRSRLSINSNILAHLIILLISLTMLNQKQEIRVFTFFVGYKRVHRGLDYVGKHESGNRILDVAMSF